MDDWSLDDKLKQFAIEHCFDQIYIQSHAHDIINKALINNITFVIDPALTVRIWIVLDLI